MTEIKYEKGREFVEIAHRYLGSTLKFDNFWKVHEKTGKTKAYMVNGKTHYYDITCAFIEKYEPLTRKPVYVEVKDRSSSNDLGGEYNEFLLRAFSVFLNEQKYKEKGEEDSRYLFFVNHPFYCNKFEKIRKMDYIKELVANNPEKYGIGGSYSLSQIQKFCSLVWIIIFCREPQELFFHDNNRGEIIYYLNRVHK
jgi:hypothetical protein